MPRKNNINDVFRNINMHGGNRDVCWEWKGSINKKDGRPYFTVEGRKRPAYNVALEAFIGHAPDSGCVARHRCDNPICCNPTHLDWGSKQDNSDDMVSRERHGLPKTVIRAIRTLLKEERSQQEIADLYGVSRETVSSIATGRSHSEKD